MSLLLRLVLRSVLSLSLLATGAALLAAGTAHSGQVGADLARWEKVVKAANVRLE